MKYPAVLERLLTPSRFAALGPGTPTTEVRATLADLEVPLPGRAGLYLYFNFLDESHEISQELHTPEGSMWHAIMHRREPDAANSKYWWRKVGTHRVLEQLREQSPALGSAFTTPDAFVDFCEHVRDTGTPDEDLAKRVQLLEWQLLFDFCWRKGKA